MSALIWMLVASASAMEVEVAMGLSGGGCRTGNYALGVMRGMAMLEGPGGESAAEALDFLASVSGAGWGVGAMYAEGAEALGLPRDGEWTESPLQAALADEEHWQDLQERMLCNYNFHLALGTGRLIQSANARWRFNPNVYGRTLVGPIAGVKDYDKSVPRDERTKLRQGLTLSHVTADDGPIWHPVATWLSPTLSADAGGPESYAPYGFVHDLELNADGDKRRRLSVVPFSESYLSQEMPLTRYLTIRPRNRWQYLEDVSQLPVAVGMMASSAVPPAAAPVLLGICGRESCDDESVARPHYLVDGAFSDRYSVATAARWLTRPESPPEEKRAVLLLVYSRPQLNADWWTTNGRIPHKVGVQQAFEVDNVLTDYEDLSPILDFQELAEVQNIAIKSPGEPDGEGVSAVPTQVVSLGLELLTQESIWEGWEADMVCRGAVTSLYDRVALIPTDVKTSETHQEMLIAAGQMVLYLQQYRLAQALWGAPPKRERSRQLPTLLAVDCSAEHLDRLGNKRAK